MNYIEDLQRAQRELTALLQEKKQLEIAIARKQQRIAALAVLAEQEADLPGLQIEGLTEACLSVLRAAAPTPMTPVEVRDGLLQLRFPLVKYKNALAVIHTKLKRLAGAGELLLKQNSRGEVAYEWAGAARIKR